MTPDLSNAVWRTSIKSQNNGGCVEVASVDAYVAVRDSQRREAGALVVDAAKWGSFLDQVRAGLDGSSGTATVSS